MVQIHFQKSMYYLTTIEIINNNNNLNIKKIRNNILKKFDVSLYKSSVYLILHKNSLIFKNTVVKNILIEDDKLLEHKINLKHDLFFIIPVYFDDKDNEKFEEKIEYPDNIIFYIIKFPNI